MTSSAAGLATMAAGGAVATLITRSIHYKAQLISAALDLLVMGEELATPQDADWWRRMTEESDPVAALHHFVRGPAGTPGDRSSSRLQMPRQCATDRPPTDVMTSGSPQTTSRSRARDSPT